MKPQPHGIGRLEKRSIEAQAVAPFFESVAATSGTSSTVRDTPPANINRKSGNRVHYV
jgi:hypothetical protein